MNTSGRTICRTGQNFTSMMQLTSRLIGTISNLVYGVQREKQNCKKLAIGANRAGLFTRKE